jgi:hypothetical protein
MIDNENRDSQPLGDSTASGIGEDGGGPRLGGLSSELSAVMMSAGQCDVEVAGAYQSGIHCDPTDHRVAQRSTIPEQLDQADLVPGARPNYTPP